MKTTLNSHPGPEALLALCKEIEMPEAATAALAAKINTDPLEEYDAFILPLLDEKTAEATSQQLLEQAGEANGITILAVYLKAALLAWDAIYQPLQIPRQVYTETMRGFSIFMTEQMQRYQDTNFNRGFWCWRFTAGLEYRLGTLQYEMCAFKPEGKATEIPEGAPVISIHIPSDAVLTEDRLHSSYRAAHQFFARYYPAYQYQAAYTNTWLLAPSLDALLAPSSKILVFRQDYRVLWDEPQRDDVLEFVFGRRDLPLAQLPQNTSLQRKIMAVLQQGGQVGAAFGVLQHGGQAFTAKCNPF